MLEADVKRRIVADFKEGGHYARRIEDSFSVGFPDLVLIPKLCPTFFTEVKRFTGQRFAPSPRQYVEMRRMSISPHVIPCVLGWKDGALYLHNLAEYCLAADSLLKGNDESTPDFFIRFYKERYEI